MDASTRLGQQTLTCRVALSFDPHIAHSSCTVSFIQSGHNSSHKQALRLVFVVSSSGRRRKRIVERLIRRCGLFFASPFPISPAIFRSRRTNAGQKMSGREATYVS